ncbi:alcohol acyltransferase 1-like [Rhododendron vialii]|uniref:alcohol acyltransferase 1-like n=1 Tax=Rhododendron vialii TaxID=182163 RepID=UPI00265FB59D|nr:alcohol acyltransferase 1-like [Rhododendron vialii]
MSTSSSSIWFTVTRQEPRLVVPAEPTPHELKQLSDIDDQEGLRFQVPMITFYKSNPFMEGEDPVSVIREGLAKALSFYYPFAGRLVEGPNRKLLVDCTSDGVLFVEADAEVELNQLGDAILPGCPVLEELLHDVPGSDGILGCPLLLLQVTRFRCGGFAIALRLNHTMSDGVGLVQFLSAIAEFVQGKEVTAPSVSPVWQRELLSARHPPRITCLHHEYEQGLDTNNDDANSTPIQKPFFFGPKEIRAIRNHLPPHASATTFEVLTACLWRCRTRALALDPNNTVRISCLVNGRSLPGLNVPHGYYGNVITYPAAVSKAGKVCSFPLEYTVELVKMAKHQMTAEYFRSVADLMVIKGRPLYTMVGNFFVSDLRRLGFETVDFGWGKPVYGGSAGSFPLISFYMNFKDGIVVPICLPIPVMERFEEELKKITKEPFDGSVDHRPPKITSMLIN